MNNFTFSFNLFYHQLTTFSASGPFYFVLFYVQLVFISTILYSLFKKSLLPNIILIIFLYYISKFSNNNTIIEGIYGRGGYILEGSYLFTFGLGMFSHKIKTILTSFSIILFYCCYLFLYLHMNT